MLSLGGWLRATPEERWDAPFPADRFVALDTETTGLDARRDLPVEVAAIPFADGEPQHEQAYVSYVNPGRPIPPLARAVHGIDDALVESAPGPHHVLAPLCDRCPEGTVLVGFHIGFDLAVLNRVARRAGAPQLAAPALDVAALAGGLSPAWFGLDLAELAGHLQIPVSGRHTAQGDAVTAGRIFLRLIPALHARGIRTLRDALAFQERGSRTMTRGTAYLDFPPGAP
ncbi:3'-5' exonuclease [Limnochorda pilosa]|uniref:DNA polymerase III subunit epsilon n=1 Tax=Limnochorda pilosa TaxID=1555112 RepID=A0A0K2SFW4_LIMPI|nr:3'-5' exonuclease [Limnochorda pilosa]BAS25927.1 DNA polymerase III subunit epsilon [Limnochorda pilosa]